MSVSTNALHVAPVKNDRLAYTYTWEKLFSTFIDNDLDKFDKTGKGTPYSALLVRIIMKFFKALSKK